MALRRLAFLTVCCLLLNACIGSGGESEGPDPGPPATNATSAPLLPAHVADLPEMSPSRFDALLEQLRGTPVIVNFWASWCQPCVAEAPLLRHAAATYGRRIQFLGVDILDDRSGASGFLESHDANYPNLFDPSGSIRDDLGVLGQPITAFYDADGAPVNASWNPWKAQLTPQALQSGIDRLLS